jgi:tetratricopeptide (TPR) repeat protein
MKRFPLLMSILLISSAAMGQHDPSMQQMKPATLMAGLGSVHHPTSTDNPEAQRFFDQGLALVYAFNHDEAVRAFRRAAELDPQMAMAYWGVALSLGPNINLPIDPDRAKTAYETVQKALELSVNGPAHERAYIEALAKRYSMDPQAEQAKLDVDYKNAMGELVKRYPDDLDAATLYAESMMNLRPWQLWNRDGTPAEGTEEIIAVLESVLKRHPNHIGANHYYIHAVEASLNPERGLPSAERLKTLAPAAGHLVHMPAHIYMRVGDYEAAVRANEAGMAADEAYISSTGAQGVYPLMYYNHNIHFFAVACSMEGRFADAKRAADKLFANGQPFVKMMPMLDGYMATPLLIQVRFRRWDDILAEPKPGEEMPITTAIWHFARGLSYAAKGDVETAGTERAAFLYVKERIPAEALVGLSSALDVLHIAQNILDARIAMAKADQQSAIELLRQAVEKEDALNYDEPPDWHIPVRETLGGVLLSSGDYAEAETVFRAELRKNPRNGRALFGLHESLKAQGEDYAAQLVWKEFEAAWKNADTQLRMEDL